MARRSRWTQEQEEAEAETGTPCARGHACSDADYQGIPRNCPRAFCEKDWQWIGNAITGMPASYVSLRMLIGRSQQQEERVSGSRDAPIPLAADIDAFMREIVHIVLSWEDAVRAAGRMSDYPDGRRRDPVALADACKTLAANQTTLISLPPTEVLRAASRKRVDDIIDAVGDEPDDGTIRYDSSGEAWETVLLDGTEAGLEFLWLNGRVRGMLGLNRRRRRITEVPCDDCKSTTLVQWEGREGDWEPVIRCTACPNGYIGARFELLMGRIYTVQMERLQRHSRVA